MITATASPPAKLSVVVPVRNSAPWIGELLESLGAQGVPGLEVVLVDNGSTDGTADIAAGAAGDGLVLRVLRSGASSAAAARNEGVATATGEYLVFADADDLVPDGAYRALLASLEDSGSDMAIGDHLKFAPARTWSPTERWRAFDRVVTAARPEEIPQLLSGRACWNRMFRRSFWDSRGLRFPEIASLEDMLPMTEAFVAAQAVDVVTECVYLYRDRSDDASLSRRADLEATLRYFEQERRCVDRTAGVAALRRQHAEIVLDADGWAHLDRFLRSNPAPAAIAVVSAAARHLLDALPDGQLASVAPTRRALWLLVVHDLWQTAVTFASATTDGGAPDRVQAWVSAVADLATFDRGAASCLATEGLVPAFVNGADGWEVSDLAALLRALVPEVVAEQTGDGLAGAMASAIVAGDAAAVRLVSALRHHVPLVVSHVPATESGLVLSGGTALAGLGARLSVVFEGPVRTELPVRSTPSGGWSVDLQADLLPVPGRYRTHLLVDGVSGAFPVVTARMPLPPLDDHHPLQPLADRADGWRFLVDRRSVGRGVAAVRRRLRGLFGRAGR